MFGDGGAGDEGEFKYAEGVTEISLGLEQRDYPRKTSRKLFHPEGVVEASLPVTALLICPNGNGSSSKSNLFADVAADVRRLEKISDFRSGNRHLGC
jgi:hypothetical protein